MSHWELSPFTVIPQSFACVHLSPVLQHRDGGLLPRCRPLPLDWHFAMELVLVNRTGESGNVGILRLYPRGLCTFVCFILSWLIPKGWGKREEQPHRTGPPRRQTPSSPLSALGLNGCLIHSISVKTDKCFGKSRDVTKYYPEHHFP